MNSQGALSEAIDAIAAERSFTDDDSMDVDDYLLTVPAQKLADPEDYLAVLDGFPTTFPPGERFPHCNGAYDLVRTRICEPAGDGRWRSNVFHLPVRGVGDGGVYTTVADVSSFWRWVAEMVRPHNDVPGEPMRCGLGFFLHQSRDQVMLIGQDAGVSFMSVHDPAPGLTYTVIPNTADGAWPVQKHLRERFSG